MEEQCFFKVGGGIIKELSDNIPSHLIALNELIKNAYDANSDKIIISLNKNSFTIEDFGEGMNKEDIKSLVHLSKSDKKYGKLKNGRYTQGSKGLGFVSASKFGHSAKWLTKKDGAYEFEIDFKKLKSIDDISEVNIDVKQSKKSKNGTIIKMDLKEEAYHQLNEYFKDDRMKNKILNSFLDDNFNIELKIKNKIYRTKAINNVMQSYDKRYDGRILYNVEYNSDEGLIKFKHNGYILFNIEYPLKSTKFKIGLNLDVFQLKSGLKANKLPSLFFNEINNPYPIIYINKNLFDNYNLFNPNINRSKKSDKSLPIMTGYVEIISSDKDLQFNSDRTKFTESKLTKEIKSFLLNINKTIQEEGSKNKLGVIDFFKAFKNNLLDIPSNCSTNELIKLLKENIKDNFKFKDKVSINVNKSRVEYNFLDKKYVVNLTKPIEENLKHEGKKIEKIKNDTNSIFPENKTSKEEQITIATVNDKIKRNLKPAIILLKSSKKRIKIPSEQIDLYQFIKEATDSKGNKINFKLIKMKINGNLIDKPILKSIEKPCIKEVKYFYEDKETKNVVSKLILQFEENNVTFKVPDENNRKLFSLPAGIKTDYNLTSKCEYLNNLILELNNLDIQKNRYVIACSLRCVFEIGMDEIELNCNIKFNNNKLHLKVQEFIENCKNNKKFISKVSLNTNFGFNSLKNLIVDSKNFSNLVEKSNIGAHKSSIHYTKNDIEDIANKASIFIILANEFIKFNTENK